PLQEQARLNGIAVDAVFDSVSVATTFREELIKDSDDDVQELINVLGSTIRLSEKNANNVAIDCNLYCT
ncbi:MAG: hypothetical protein CML12_00060, partial [Puniceicoccaceae bacterium]|nr:hypothetical protein [Puniceicoccaceae bacterium]